MAKPEKNAGPVTHHALSQRLMDLCAETRIPQPYPITDTLVVTPPDRHRRRGMYEADIAIFMARQMLAQALKAAAEPAPEPPPDAPTSDEVDDESAATEESPDSASTHKQHTEAMAAWMQRTAEVATRIKAINAQIESAADDYDRAFFGVAYDAVMEFADAMPFHYDRLLPDIKAEFLPAAPDDGTCSQCGQVVDEEQAKKAHASST